MQRGRVQTGMTKNRESRMARFALSCFVLMALMGAQAGQSATRQVGDGDWPGYGRTHGQQHYSPLAEISVANVRSLGLAWSHDLPFGNSATEPLAVGGTLYMATGLSVVRAIDAASGRLLWAYDPQAALHSGINLRLGWGVRGLAWSGGRLFVGTQDGRLTAVDARSGKPVWSVRTFAHGTPAYISGAPRVFGNKVLIGFGSSGGATRGYVTAFEAATGKQVWRFWTVPGDPAKGFENAAMAMAAKTWSGEWWKFGGGGDVWNSMAYDAATRTVFIGVGSPYPWNHRVRSAGKGDNLFIDSIVALNVDTGAYKWHYQTVPGDTWDFDAAMDIELADLVIDGRLRKVIMQAPKNGFFYVIDRDTGKLISADPFVKVTWASKVDPASGRPVEAPGARFGDGKPVLLEPTPLAAHNWLPMASNPKTGLVYIPAVNFALYFTDTSKGWQPSRLMVSDGAVGMIGGDASVAGPLATHPTGRLIAWSPVERRVVWQVPHPTYVNGGVLTTAGGLVFQGTVDGKFSAYDASSGKLVWQFDAGSPIMAAPISYRVGGRQYVSVLTGLGMAYPGNAAALQGPEIANYAIDPRSQRRRVLTFVLGGKNKLPAASPSPPAFVDPEFRPDPARIMAGAMSYAESCATCHGSLGVGINHGPDLRRSPVTPSAESFRMVVRDGVLKARGMPPFPEMSEQVREDIRTYLRAVAAQLRATDKRQ